MIKQIQLRGISRTPSDRMSDDGGLSESLNMHLDSAENAPVFVPEDITDKLGLPPDFQADQVFIHKTPNYENYIVVQGKNVGVTGKVVSENKISTFLTLEDGEEISSITSIGNTVVISTTKSLRYLLYKDGEYSFLGSQIPFPFINFEKRNHTTYSEAFTRQYDESEGYKNNFLSMWFLDYPNLDVSNKMTTNPLCGIIPEELDTLFPRKDIDEKMNTLLVKIRNDKHISGVCFIRYACTLYDGQKISSMPLLIVNENANINVLASSVLTNSSGEYYIKKLVNKADLTINAYDIYAFCEQSELEKLYNWTDIIQSIDFYISYPSDFKEVEKYIVIGRTYAESTYGDDGVFKSRTTKATLNYIGVDAEETFLLDLSSQTFCVKKYLLWRNYCPKRSCTKGCHYLRI